MTLCCVYTKQTGKKTRSNKELVLLVQPVTKTHNLLLFLAYTHGDMRKLDK